MPATQHDGRVVTFYSYKGGTGRTMTLANVAWILASNGRKVLMVDWDLEAPGLHRYFHPFLVDKELLSSPGIIDMMWDFVDRAMAPADEQSAKRSDEWYEPLADISQYAVHVRHDFGNGGRLDLAPSGRQGASYPARVNSFDWRNFYERLGGGAFIDALRRSMKSHYDYVLVDSRTGVSDTSGICTVQLPEVLVTCFTLNLQSIRGASGVARSVREHRHADDLRILPVPTRVETGEDTKMRAALAVAERAFADFVPTGWSVREYFGSVQLPYKPLYAYEEQLSAIRDDSWDSLSMLPRLVALTSAITDRKVQEVIPVPDQRRYPILADYDAVLGGSAPQQVPAQSPFDAWRHEIETDADTWAKDDRPRALLLGGPRLAESEHWLATRRRDVSPLVSNYLEASLNARSTMRSGGWWRALVPPLRVVRRIRVSMADPAELKDRIRDALGKGWDLTVDLPTIWYFEPAGAVPAVIVWPDPDGGAATVSVPRHLASIFRSNFAVLDG